ncbi:MAG: DUF6159 family protein [Acidobacteriota bacterium]
MFAKISRSWSLVKASASVLQADKELMIFPMLSGVASVITGVLFFLPLTFLQGGGFEMAGYVALFLFYFVSTFVVVFFNSALVGAALIRLDGGDPTVADGLRIARQRLPLIVQWSLLAATVGLLMRAAREKSNGLAKFAMGLIGVAWNVATFLIVPVLVTRDLNPIDALKESASLLKKTWGEQIVGNAGIGLIFWLVGIAYSVIAIPAVLLSFSTGAPWVGVPVLVAVVIGYGLIVLTSATLSGIYSAALFRYATVGEVRGIDRQLLASAFEPR